MSRVSSFKPQYRQAPARSVTPPRPVYEPLSPILLPSGPPTTLPHPAGARNRASTPPIHPPKPINGALQSTPVFAETPLSQPPQGSLALRYEPPRRSSAAVSRPNPQQSLALGSPIEASPTAAMSSSAASLALHLQTDPPRRISHAPVSPTAVSHAPAPTERVPKHAYIPDPTYAYDTRPAKRVRSEFFTSPHYGHQHHHQQQPQPRPATSHLPAWSYNVEQMVDNGVRMYQQDNHPAPSSSEDSRLKRLSDAQLLMDFAFGASHTTHAPPASTAKRWSISHPSQPDLSSQIPYEASSSHLGPRHVSVSYLQEVQRPVDIKYGPELPRESADANSAAPTIQTHTPPEDPAAMPLPPVVHATPNAEESKPKKHQGWPKGKPRGPRNTPIGGKKKRSTPKPKNVPASVAAPPPVDPTGTADQLQSPQSLPTERSGSGQATSIPVESESLNVLESQNRRHSFSNTQPDTQNLGVPSTILRSQSVPPDTGMLIAGSAPEEAPPRNSKKGADALDPICAGCHSSDSMTVIGEGEQWISCDGCKEWYHFGCAGFNNEREVRDVDKFYCEPCRPKHGPTTKVRKSARAHTAVDYAGLNEGILKTSDDNPEHHYIAAFKNGDITFTPETFARMPPELISADYLEKTNGFKEPILIPASLNSRPKPPGLQNSDAQLSEKDSFDEQQEAKLHFEYETVLDDGQDKLDMVIPQGLTVRRVAELYGPNEPVPVIDVKAQEGEDKRWTMSKWADYYEQQGEKPVRNVISLEVSRSRLGRLIRRPKAVRDMDLQDSVWREDDKAPPPPVQFYCLMSVADCYTDFHIDFGGSSVYYHIVKGRKVFFFIPPTKQNLKKYEDWCLAPNQGHEWLGGQVKECYRVDLYPGDTMLIPSGWIHAVWTPSDSLVIGGNFLTRIHYGMQIKVLEIEKNTKVALKFRYPFFQKIMWLTAIAYLEDDPIPDSVEQLLTSGDEFKRNTPIYCEPDAFGNNSHLGPENYNRRYYPKSELEGLTDLLNYIWRTVLISLERIEVTPKVRNAVTRSIPKGHGEPLHLARRFAAWVAWKRGNESIPQWAFPDASLPDTTESGDKKLSAAQIKRMERESANEALRATAERSSARIKDGLQNTTQSSNGSTPMTGFLRPAADPSRHMTTPKTSQLGPKRVACDACRKRRIRCKHKDELVDTPRPGMHTIDLSGSFGISVKRRLSDLTAPSGHGSATDGPVNGGPIMADVNADPYALKSGRVKACADCRKSKRRCIHDEYGNVDPIKAMEVPIPRGSASKKRRVSEGDPASAKKMKQDPTADGGAMNGEVHAPSSLSNPSSVDGPSSLQDIAYSVQQAMDQDPAEDQVPIDPALQAWGTGSGSGFDMAPSRPPHRDAVVSSIEYHPDGPVPMDGVEHSERSEPQGPSVEPLTPGPPSHTAEPNGIISGQSHDPSPSTTHAHRRTASLELNNHGATLPPPPKTPTANAHRASRIPSASRKSSHTPSRGMDSNRKSKTPKSTPSGSGRRHNSKELIQLEPKDKIMGTEKDADLELALRLQAEEHGLRRRSSR